MMNCFLYSMWFVVILFLFNIHSTCLASKTDSNNYIVSYQGFIDVLKSLDLLNQYPNILKNGTCYAIDEVSVRKNENSKMYITVTINIKKSNGTSEMTCSNDYYNKIRQSPFYNINDNSSSQEEENNKNHAFILPIYQTIGIIICALLLGLFFFIAGIIRLKNFLRRNNNTFKLAGLQSCLTNDIETQKWRPPVSDQSLNHSTISNYLQLQSVIDKNVSQFMVRSNHYSKSVDLENKKLNMSIKRKVSLKNKLLPKRMAGNQNSQRRYSLTNEIESVMSKHFNMIGVTKKYGSKSTQNIGGSLMPPMNRQHQHSMINDLSFSSALQDSIVNGINDSSSVNTSLPSRYPRHGNFPGRRATTIGGRSNNSNSKYNPKPLEKNPSSSTIYSSYLSVVVPQTSKQTPLLKKQLTLQEGIENQALEYSSTNPKLCNNEIKILNKIDSEACYLKVPFKSLNLLSNKKCIFHLSDEKTSPSPESKESNSRCSSFDKASSTWSSLEVQEES